MQKKEDNVLVYPPNKAFERNLNYSEIPIIHESLFYIDFNIRREPIIGSSNVKGTVWEGATFWFRTLDDLESLNWSAYYIGPTSSDAKYLNEDTVALAEDTGDLQILNINEKTNIKSYLFFRHFARIQQIAVWNNSTKILTCSDRTITILDANTSKKTSEVYANLHSEQILSVDTLKYQENCFISCGADRKALIWDKRNEDIASVLYTNEFTALTSIAWNQNNDNYIVCGTEGGDIYLLDKREPKSFIEVNHCYKSSIHRISFNPNSNQFALCGDTNEILVFDSSEHLIRNVYSSKEHNDIARGLGWCQDALYSCGFDKKVCRHLL